MSARKQFIFVCCLAISVLTALGLTVAVLSYLLDSSFEEQANVLKITLYAPGFIIILSPGFVLMAPWLGGLSDFNGRRLVLMFCLVSALIGYLILWQTSASSYPISIIIASFFLSIGTCLLPIIQTILIDINPRRLILIIALYEVLSLSLKYWIYFGMHLLKGNKVPVWQLFEFCFAVCLINVIFSYFIFQESNSKRFRQRFFHPQLYFKQIRKLGMVPIRNYLLAFIFFSLAWTFSEHIFILHLNKLHTVNVQHAKLLLVWKLSILLIGAWLMSLLQARNRVISAWLTINVLCFLGGALLEFFTHPSIWHWVSTTLISLGVINCITYCLGTAAALFDRRHLGLFLGITAALQVLTLSFGNVTAEFMQYFTLDKLTYFLVVVMLGLGFYLLPNKQF